MFDFAQIYFVKSTVFSQVIRSSICCYLCFQLRGGECKAENWDDFSVYGILRYQGAPQEIPREYNDTELSIPEAVFNLCTETNDSVGITDLNHIGKNVE